MFVQQGALQSPLEHRFDQRRASSLRDQPGAVRKAKVDLEQRLYDTSWHKLRAHGQGKPQLHGPISTRQ